MLIDRLEAGLRDLRVTRPVTRSGAHLRVTVHAAATESAWKCHNWLSQPSHEPLRLAHGKSHTGTGLRVQQWLRLWSDSVSGSGQARQTRSGLQLGLPVSAGASELWTPVQPESSEAAYRHGHPAAPGTLAILCELECPLTSRPGPGAVTLTPWLSGRFGHPAGPSSTHGSNCSESRRTTAGTTAARFKLLLRFCMAWDQYRDRHREYSQLWRSYLPRGSKPSKQRILSRTVAAAPRRRRHAAALPALAW